MSKDGRIGNRALLQRLANNLQMEGVNRAPADLNRDQVQVVVDLGRFFEPPIGQAEEPTVSFDTQIVDLSGLASSDVEIYPATAAGVLTRFLSFALEVSGPIDASPAYGQVRLYYQLPVGQPYRFVDLLDAFLCDGSQAWIARFANAGYTLGEAAVEARPAILNWPGYVPSEVPIRLQVSKANSGLTFPAGTSMTWSRLAVRYNQGDPPPF